MKYIWGGTKVSDTSPENLQKIVKEAFDRNAKAIESAISKGKWQDYLASINYGLEAYLTDDYITATVTITKTLSLHDQNQIIQFWFNNVLDIANKSYKNEQKDAHAALMRSYIAEKYSVYYTEYSNSKSSTIATITEEQVQCLIDARIKNSSDFDAKMINNFITATKSAELETDFAEKIKNDKFLTKCLGQNLTQLDSIKKIVKEKFFTKIADKFAAYITNTENHLTQLNENIVLDLKKSTKLTTTTYKKEKKAVVETLENLVKEAYKEKQAEIKKIVENGKWQDYQMSMWGKKDCGLGSYLEDDYIRKNLKLSLTKDVDKELDAVRLWYNEVLSDLVTTNTPESRLMLAYCKEKYATKYDKWLKYFSDEVKELDHDDIAILIKQYLDKNKAAEYDVILTERLQLIAENNKITVEDTMSTLKDLWVRKSLLGQNIGGLKSYSDAITANFCKLSLERMQSKFAEAQKAKETLANILVPPTETATDEGPFSAAELDGDSADETPDMLGAGSTEVNDSMGY